SARRRWDPLEVLPPDVRRRRRGRLPRPQDHPRPPLLPLAGGGARGGGPQAQRVHRPVRLVAEVLPADPGAVRADAAQVEGTLRHRLPRAHAGEVADRVRQARLRRRRTPPDPQGQRGEAPGSRRRLIASSASERVPRRAAGAQPTVRTGGSISVSAQTSSGENPGATDSTASAPSRRRNTARSVTTMSAQALAVSGYVHRWTSFGCPWLSWCSMSTMTVAVDAARSMAPPIPPPAMPGVAQLA